MPEPLEAFTTKEMLLSIIAKLDRMEVKLDTKADEAALTAVEIRVQNIERIQQAGEMRANLLVPQIQKMQEEVVHLKELAISLRSVDIYRRWLFGTAILGSMGFLLTAFQVFGVL